MPTLQFDEEHIDGQFGYDAENHDDGDFMALALRVQDSLQSKRIWGKGVSIPRDEAVSILQSWMQSLSSIQIAQFHLMNGMLASGLFLPLAQVLGSMTGIHTSNGKQLGSPPILKTSNAFVRRSQ